jgi:cell wall-associated NlpC family hydrolase
MSGTRTTLWCAGVRAIGTLVLAALMVTAWLSAPAAAKGPAKYLQRRKQVERRARSQVGAPYAYGGASPSGYDCSGFTLWVFRGHGASLPHSAAAQFALAGRGRHKRLWKRRKLRTGDLVFFDTTGARIGHSGIYLGKGKFISATSSSGVRVDSVWDRYYWGPRWVAGTRVPALRKPPQAT